MRWTAGGVAGAAILAAGAFGGWQYETRAQIAELVPAPDSAVATDAPQIVVRLDGADRVSDLSVSVNGRDVTSGVRAAKDRLIIPTSGLEDGAQTVEVSFGTSNLFSRSVSRRWDFDVDTAPPTLSAKLPRDGDVSKRKAVRFTGTAEPGSAVAVNWKGGSASGTAGPDGAYAVTAKLPEGDVAATVSAADRAGNTTRASQGVVVDTIAPVIALSGPKPGAILTDTASPRVIGTVVKDDPKLLTFGATVNGKEAISMPGSAALTTSSDTGLVEAAVTTAPLELDGRRFSLAVGDLPQGRSTVTVWAKDRAGNISAKTVKVMVDSAEDFGANDLRIGARGEDARTLNERLKQAGVLRGKVTSTFNQKTLNAVLKYQKRHRLKRTGAVNAATREAMVGRIVVDLSEYSLKLIRDGRVVKRYKIAIGQAAYPTPTGTYEVVNMQTNPTWMPPNSPWAKGLGPIPPGPGNPLGTRWIGTSAPAVGIHGTYADYSIGTAASHGCMRMHIPEVEALYEEVSVGMPVIIKA
ncbi:MAG: L,D-transpeptidase family protein [Thermoleophilia bacterium]|nr:L,D-transpeptidase family protein [Thermoleophilia bacterium]